MITKRNQVVSALKKGKGQCQHRDSDGRMCGDIWRVVKYRGKRRLPGTLCYSNHHPQDAAGKQLDLWKPTKEAVKSEPQSFELAEGVAVL